MTSHVALFTGLVVGFSVAVPIGPMGLLCIQRTLACGMRAGVCTGLGAATVNVLYGALILLGMDRLAPLVVSGSRLLSFAGGLYLLWTASRTFRRKGSLSGSAEQAPQSAFAAYASALLFNAANPMGPLMIMSLLSPLVGASVPCLPAAAVMLFGMFAAATGWWISLSGGVSLLRSRLNPRVLTMVNQMAGVALTFYAALALARAAGE